VDVELLVQPAIYDVAWHPEGIVNLAGSLPTIRIAVSEMSPFGIVVVGTKNARRTRDGMWNAIFGQPVVAILPSHLQINEGEGWSAPGMSSKPLLGSRGLPLFFQGKTKILNDLEVFRHSCPRFQAH